MYTYQMQYPNMNTPKYTPRGVRPGMLSKLNEIQIDVSELKPVPVDIPQVAIAIWLSAWINAINKLNRELMGAFMGETPSVFTHSCNVRRYTSIYEVVTYLNTIAYPYGWSYHLSRVATWEDVKLALLEGFTVMAGGTVYSSFDKAVHTGVVPMPKPEEDLLGGQIVNIVGFNQETDMALAIGNMGMDVGKQGMFQYRGSHLRNLGIFRDYFLLTSRYTDAS